MYRNLREPRQKGQLSNKTFLAELKEVKSKKTPSLDIEVRIVLVTDDVSVLDLGKDNPETIYKVEIKHG